MLLVTTHEWIFCRDELPQVLQNRHAEVGGCSFKAVLSNDDALPGYCFECWTIRDEAEPYDLSADIGHFLDVLSAEDPGLASHIHNFQMNPCIGG